MPIEIESPRLFMRPWTLADAPHYETMSKDIGYNCFATPGYYLARDAADLLAKIQQRIDTFDKQAISKMPIFRKSDGAFVGTCGADSFDFEGRPELEMGYRLLLTHWNQGYATEAAAAMRDYLFQRVKAKAIYGFAVGQNGASIKVLEKIGFRYLQPMEHAGFEHKLYVIRSLTGL